MSTLKANETRHAGPRQYSKQIVTTRSLYAAIKSPIITAIITELMVNLVLGWYSIAVRTNLFAFVCFASVDNVTSAVQTEPSHLISHHESNTVYYDQDKFYFRQECNTNCIFYDSCEVRY